MNQNDLRIRFLQQAQTSLESAISKFTSARSDISFGRYLTLLGGFIDYVAYLNYVQVARGDEEQDREIIIALIKGYLPDYDGVGLQSADLMNILFHIEVACPNLFNTPEYDLNCLIDLEAI